MASYIEHATGKYPLSAREVSALFPQTSFPSDPALRDEAFLSLGYWIVQTTQTPSFDYRVETVEETAPAFLGDHYEQTWAVVPLSQEDITRIEDTQAEAVRADRTRRLYVCDFTILPDAPTSSRNADWTAYRQALRDITEQPGFPWDVVWPEPPAGGS